MSINSDTLEPLEHLLALYSDKHRVLIEYLPTETIQSIKDYEYIDINDLYVTDY